MKFWFFILITLIQSAEALELMNWTVKTSPNDIIVPLQMHEFSALQIHQGENELLFMASKHPAHSLGSITTIMKEMKADMKSLEIIKKNKNTYFRFQTSPNQFHLFSMKGGYLQVNTGKLGHGKKILEMVKL